MKIGMIGAGFVNRGIARLALYRGHDVMISNSRGPQTLGSAATALRSRKGTVKEAAAFGDILVLAIPYSAIRDLDPALFEGKIVLDATNYYPERDGRVAELDAHQATTTGLVARHLKGARVVKFFNAILQEDIEPHARPAGTNGRRALPVAGDDAEAKRVAMALMDELGFDPVDAGGLDESWRFERAMPAYCRELDAAGLRRALAAAERGVEGAHGSWRRTELVPPAQSAPRNYRGTFEGRGDYDIVDAQFHISPREDVTMILGAMNALGIRSVLLDELWGFDADGRPVPHARVGEDAIRPLTPLAIAASVQHPGKFSYLQRITRLDPQGVQLIEAVAVTPGCRSLRASLLTPDERQRFAAGEWDAQLAAAERHNLPICILAEDAGQILGPVASRFGGLRIVVDHCGWGRTPQQWEDTLALAQHRNIYLKWSHARKAFRRFDDPKAAQHREFVRAVETFGAERVLWAADASFEESNATWGELLDFVRTHPGLSDGDRARVLGGAARAVFNWPV